jgi:hypothetical protein
MGEPLWRTTREKMFERVKKAMMRARTEAQATSEPWMPFIGAEYWSITDIGVVENHRWEGNRLDTGRWELGNVFRTKPEAEHAREKLQEVLRSLHTNQARNTHMSTPS